MKIIKLLICLSFLTSCVDNLGYISIIKNSGKKKIIKTQVPEFNKQYIRKKKYADYNSKNKHDKNINLKTRKNINIEKRSVNAAKSTAYDTKSIIDNNKKIYETAIHNQNVIKTSIAEEEKILEKTITIEDFKYLPNYLFKDPVKEEIVEIQENKTKENKIISTNENTKLKTDVNITDKNTEIDNKEKNEISKENNKENKLIEKNELVNIVQNDNKLIKQKELLNNEIEEEKLEEIIATNLKDNNTNKKVNNSNENKTDILFKNKNTEKIFSKEKTQNKTLKEKKTSNKTLIKGKFYLQLGSLKNQKLAEKTLSKFTGILDNCFILNNSSNNNKEATYSKIICGHFDNKQDANLSKDKVIKMGHYDVFVFKK